MLLRQYMFNMMRELAVRLGQETVFATIVRALPDEIALSGLHPYC